MHLYCANLHIAKNHTITYFIFGLIVIPARKLIPNLENMKWTECTILNTTYHV